MLTIFNRLKRHIYFCCICFPLYIFFFPVLTHAQSNMPDSTMSFDLLLAPPCPGFVLLGIEPASVERPGNVTDLAVTILSKTENLNMLPENFAIEIAPYWLFAGSAITYDKYTDHRNIGSNILQSASFSIANSSDSVSASLALGVRFSILRGVIDSKFNNYAVRLDSLYRMLNEINIVFASEWMKRIQIDETVKSLKDAFPNADSSLQPIIESLITQRESEIKREVEAEIRSKYAQELENVKAIISRLRLRRIGWKLDVAGGTAIDFPRREFDDANLKRWGAWLTGGYEWKRISSLAVLRFMGASDNSDEFSIDLGGRLILDDIKRFSLSAESVFRKFPNRSTDNDQWRLALLFDYAISKNKSISFTFGRNFDKQQGGNLLALVNILLGFGSNRPIR